MPEFEKGPETETIKYRLVGADGWKGEDIFTGTTEDAEKAVENDDKVHPEGRPHSYEIIEE